jgi:hypothetical protein
MNTHPNEIDLALLAGGECGRVSRFFLQRHVRDCRVCTAKIANFEILRSDLARISEPDLDWNLLAAEMKANIRLGLEAGACVSDIESRRRWNPRLTVAFASLTFLIAAGLTMKSHTSAPPIAVATNSPVLESTGAGLELRDGASSITLLNRKGSLADQTVSAQGEIRARNIENGTVTITNVSMD